MSRQGRRKKLRIYGKIVTHCHPPSRQNTGPVALITRRSREQSARTDRRSLAYHVLIRQEEEADLQDKLAHS